MRQETHEHIKTIKKLCLEAKNVIFRKNAFIKGMRWSGIVGVGLQRAVAHIVSRDIGADLPRTQLEPGLHVADLVQI